MNSLKRFKLFKMSSKKKLTPLQQINLLVREIPFNATLTKQYTHEIQQTKDQYTPSLMHLYAKLKGLHKKITEEWKNITPYCELSRSILPPSSSSSSSSSPSSASSSSSSSDEDAKEFSILGEKILNNFWMAIKNKKCNMYILISEHVDCQCLRFVYYCNSKDIPSVDDFENLINQGVRNYPASGRLIINKHFLCDISPAKSGIVINFKVFSDTGYVGNLDITYKDKDEKFPVLKDINA